MNRFYTLIVILLALSSWIHQVEAQDASAWMPDANLRAAVRSALNLNNNDTLTQAGMANLTSLTARNAQIGNLTGLEHATNLQKLDLRDNTISSISALSGLTNLESLKLKGNNISSVSALSGLTNLTLLNLKENNISSISTLSGLTNLEHLRVDENSITDVQPLTSLVNLNKLWIAGNSLTNAHLLSSLTGLTYIDIPIPDPPDTTAPSVTVSAPSDTQNGAFSVTITFTEAVSNFVGSDVSLSGSAASITGWNANSDNTIYTATITPTASGTVTIGVAANVATDAANNQNTAATSKSVTVSVDTTAPVVTISVPSGTQNGAFNATITFTETVSGFAQSDVSLSGSAASITSWSANSDDTVYTATITPTASGTATIGVAANVATDGANNQNTAATSKTVTVDVDRPSVSIGVPAGTQTGAFDATITFSETVSGFVGSDVSLTGSAASITAWRSNSDNTVYTATITPTASGSVTIGVAANVATDAANNQNTAATSKTVTVDVDRPSVSIGVPAGTQTGAFDVTITFTEAVSNFVGSDVSLSGSAATITSWSANSDNTVYTATITPTASGTVTIGVAANVATDAANNQNTAATSKSVTVSVDTTAPGVTVSVPSGVQNSRFSVTITFTEAVSGFTQSDLSLSGTASITSWSANSDDTVYTATITPTASGTVAIGVAANVATDAANNQNTAATSKTVTVDVNAPTVTIGVPSGTQTGAFDVTITFTEAVSGFTQSDLSLSGTASITSWSANSDDTVYTATITPTASGTVAIGVAANVATDAANNSNTAATSKTVTVDVDRPTVTIGVPAGTQTGAFDATITFSEAVSNFVGSEVSLSGSAASITGWSANSDNTVYTATITPTASGTVTIGVAANVATDAANNANTAATSKTVTVNIPDPIPDPATWMPDVNLRAAVRSALSLGSNDTLTQAGMANLTGLTARNAQIGNLTGLEHATNLQKLDLRDNTISSISALSGLTNLESLKLKGNNISSVSALSGLTNLTLLNLKENNISSISTLSGLTNLEHLRVDENSITDVQPLTSLVNLSKLWIAGNSLTNAHLLSSLTGLTYIDIPIPDPPDTTAPSVTVSVPSGVQNGAFNATITFTEAVSDFVDSDVSLSGSTASITGWNANSDNTIYTATITPTVSGTVTIGVAVNVATDAANNQNTAATSKTVTVSVDTTAPSVSISVPSGVQNGAFNVTITFTEAVSDFVDSDVSLSGSTASITGWNANSDNTIYTATITPTASGSVTIGVAANVATDAANNQNTAATSKTVTVDVDRPSVSIGVPAGTQTGAFDVTITFTEAVSNFVGSDVSLSGSAATITSWSANSDNTVYTATITPTASGTLTIGVAANVATDAANNQNTAATSKSVTVSVDTTSPDVTVSVPSSVQNSAFNAAITFTESVSGFTQSDLSLSGTASITSWSANSDDTVYTATITPTVSGTVTIGVAANVATDAANNSNTAATSKTVTVDVDRPTVTIGVPAGTQTGAFDATITFSEAVSNFVGSEVSLSGSAASITGWSANSDNTVYTATITPTASGTVTIGVAANVATDAANNQNTAATSKSVTVSVDTTAPGVTVSVPSGVQNSRFSVTITFTEAVSGFTQSDLSLSGTASITSWSANSDDTVYTATITPTVSGTVTIGVAANVATDAANNSNTAATSKTVTVDVDRPTVTIGVPSGTQTGAFNATITFSETVSGFTQSDVSLTGSAASITGWRANSGNTVYTATITPTASGTVTVSVAANIATDAVNNQNTAATSKTVTVSVDTTAPGVTVSVPSGIQNGQFSVSITFTESISIFWRSPLELGTNTAGATINSEHVISANGGTTSVIQYVTPTRSGEVMLRVPAGIAINAEGNANTASEAQTVSVDVDAPGVSITEPSDVQNGAFNATITFSETVSGFTQSDVSLTGSAASITGWRANSDNTVYTATITPTASGTVTVSVDADVATDLAGNPNTAATSKTVTVSVDTDPPGISFSADLETPFNTAYHYTANGPFDMTMTFTEPISGFEQTDIEIGGGGGDTGGSVTALTKVDDEIYTATVNPFIHQGVSFVRLHIPPGVLTDTAGNPNTRTYSPAISIEQVRPDVEITVPDATVETETLTITITFDDLNGLPFIFSDAYVHHDSRPLGFAQSDVLLTNNTAGASITKWTELQTGFNHNGVSFQGAYGVFEAEITATQSGSVTFGIPENVATDLAGNPNTAATSKTVTVSVDTDPPGVSISVPLSARTGTDGTRTSITVPSGRLETGAFDVTITFTEPVSGFEQADLSLTGTSAASITAWKTTDNTVYTPTITPTRSGTVTLGVLAGVATDAAGNPNTAATSKTVTVDVDRPTVGITVPPDVQNGAFDVTISFSEAVIGFVQSELSLSGTAAAGITAWSANTANTVYTATITPTTSGMVSLNIAADVATDTTNNPNTTAIEQSVTVDVDSPSVKLTLSASGQGGNNNRIDIQISFTEPVEGFEQTDLSVTTNGLTALESNVSGGEIPLPDGLGNIVTDEVKVEYPIVSITGWTPDPDKTTYTAYITTYTETKGQVIVSVDADVATDVAGNPNVAGEALTVDVDQPLFYFFAHSVGPAGSAPTTNCQVISPVNHYPGHPGRLDVNQDDSIDEDDVAMVEAALGQSGDGIANSRTDINCDDTVDEDDLALLNDTESPSVRIIVPTDAQPGAFDIQISFSEIVFDFDVTDISLADSTATATSTIISYSWNRSAITYRVEITPTTSGNVVINVPAAVATDALGNENTAATQETVTVDTGIPSVSITSGSVGENGVFDIVITFSEAVSGFVQEDLRLYGSANPSITAWTATDDTVFTATITPASNGRVRCYVPANVATDADNNPNSASGLYDRDANPPTVTVSVPTGEQPGAFDITFSFSEIVLDFEQTDVSLADNTADAEITDWTVVSHFLIQYGTRYEATITPTTSGTVVISVPAGVAIDLSGNGNTASASHSITVSLPGSRLAPASLSKIVLDPTVLKTLDPEMLEAHLDILRAGNDGSLKYLQAITLLESVIAEMRPEKTVLLANYPNPFNPETWIPYQLASDTDVQLSIYDINGALVRQLDLGYQRAGYYTNRSRAAYWDGRNGYGERVASGIYFYTLTANDFSSTRKMLIGK